MLIFLLFLNMLKRYDIFAWFVIKLDKLGLTYESNMENALLVLYLIIIVNLLHIFEEAGQLEHSCHVEFYCLSNNLWSVSCRPHFKFERHLNSPRYKVLDQPDVKDTLHKLHANYVLVPADKAASNVIIVCKKYYIDTLVKELGINNVNINNQTYIHIDDSFDIIVKSHNQFITSVGLEMSEEDQNLPYLYWTPKLHKSPYKHRFISGSSKCTTKDLSCLLTKVLSTIKDGLVRYCNTKTSRNGVNNMWNLKNSTSCCHHLTNLMSVQLRQSRHLIFQHFTPQSHMIYWNLESVVLYIMLSERKMGV